MIAYLYPQTNESGTSFVAAPALQRAFILDFFPAFPRNTLKFFDSFLVLLDVGYQLLPCRLNELFGFDGLSLLGPPPLRDQVVNGGPDVIDSIGRVDVHPNHVSQSRNSILFDLCLDSDPDFPGFPLHRLFDFCCVGSPNLNRGVELQSVPTASGLGGESHLEVIPSLGDDE